MDVNVLIEACEKSLIADVRRMVQSGCDPNSFGKYNNANKVPLHVACTKNDLKLVKTLLELGADSNLLDTDGKSPLYVACAVASQDVIYTLLENGAHIYEESQANIGTPLTSACESQNVTAVEILLRKGCDPNLFLEETHTGVNSCKSYLQIACEKASFKIASLLLEYGAYSTGTALHEACTCQSEDLVKLLVLHGAPVNSVSKTGNTALNIVCSKGNKNLASILLAAGADPNMTSKGGYQQRAPLHLAAEKRNLELVLLLLKKGANVNIKDQFGKTPLWVYVADFNETAKCDSAIVNALLKHGANPNFVMYDFSKALSVTTPLLLACRQKSPKLVKLFLEHGADVNFKEDKTGSTALHVVCTLAFQEQELSTVLEILSLLLKHGADINSTTCRGETALFIACQRLEAKIACFLLANGANSNICDIESTSPLMSAIKYVFDDADNQVKQYDIVCALLQHGASPDHSRADGQTALHLAVFRRYSGLIEVLLNYNACPNIQDAQGKTPLHLSCESKNSIKCDAMGAAQRLSMCNALLQKQADPCIQNRFGRSALHIAAEHCEIELLKLLLKHGANLRQADHDGNTTCHILCMNKGVEMDANLTDVLLSAGGQFTVPNFYKHTALEYACYNEHSAVVQALINHDVNINVTDCKGNSLFLSISKSNSSSILDIVKCFLKAGADINVTEAGTCRTALHKTCIDGNASLTKLLLAKKAKPNVTDINGDTPLHLACRFRHVQCVSWLLYYNADVNVCNSANETPLHEICKPGGGSRKRIVQKLLRHAKINVNIANKNRQMPLHLVCQRGWSEVLNALLTSAKKTNMDVNALDMHDNSPLHVLCSNRNNRIGNQGVVELLSHHADPNVQNSLGDTPLHLACLNSCKEYIEALVNRNANLALLNLDGKSPIHIICEKTRFEGINILQLMLEARDKAAEVSLIESQQVMQRLSATNKLETMKILQHKDRFGKTPLMCAASVGDAEVVDYLLPRSICDKEAEVIVFELLALSKISSRPDKKETFPYLERAMKSRFSGRKLVVPKPSSCSVPGFESYRECSTNAQLKSLKKIKDFEKIRIELLSMLARIMRADDPLLLERLRVLCNDATIYGIDITSALLMWNYRFKILSEQNIQASELTKTCEEFAVSCVSMFARCPELVTLEHKTTFVEQVISNIKGFNEYSSGDFLKVIFCVLKAIYLGTTDDLLYTDEKYAYLSELLSTLNNILWKLRKETLLHVFLGETYFRYIHSNENFFKLLKLLLVSPLDCFSVQCETGDSCLHKAVSKTITSSSIRELDWHIDIHATVDENSLSAVCLLLAHGADPFLLNNSGKAPLDVMQYSGLKDQPIRNILKDSELILHVACEHLRPQCVRYMLDVVHSRLQTFLKKRDEFDRTPIMCAAFANDTTTVFEMAQHKESLKLGIYDEIDLIHAFELTGALLYDKRASCLDHLEKGMKMRYSNDGAILKHPKPMTEPLIHHTEVNEFSTLEQLKALRSNGSKSEIKLQAFLVASRILGKLNPLLPKIISRMCNIKDSPLPEEALRFVVILWRIFVNLAMLLEPQDACKEKTEAALVACGEVTFSGSEISSILDYGTLFLLSDITSLLAKTKQGNTICINGPYMMRLFNIIRFFVTSLGDNNRRFHQIMCTFGDMNIRDSGNGETLLHYAVTRHIDIPEDLLSPDVLPLVHYLLKCGCSGSAIDKKGNTVLHQLMRRLRPIVSSVTDARCHDICKVLVQHSVHVDACNYQGQTAYHICPLDAPLTRSFIRNSEKMSLSCLAARAILGYRIPYRNVLSGPLIELVEEHMGRNDKYTNNADREYYDSDDGYMYDSGSVSSDSDNDLNIFDPFPLHFHW